MLVTKISEVFSRYLFFLADSMCQAGLISGIALVLIISLIIWLSCRCRRGRGDIEISDEGGLFMLSGQALRAFLKRIVLEFAEAEMTDCRVQSKHEALSLTLFLQVQAGADIVGIRAKLRPRILDEAGSKLGIAEQIKNINIRISKMQESGEAPASEKKEDTKAH